MAHDPAVETRRRRKSRREWNRTNDFQCWRRNSFLAKNHEPSSLERGVLQVVEMEDAKWRDVMIRGKSAWGLALLTRGAIYGKNAVQVRKLKEVCHNWKKSTYNWRRGFTKPQLEWSATGFAQGSRWISPRKRVTNWWHSSRNAKRARRCFLDSENRQKRALHGGCEERQRGGESRHRAGWVRLMGALEVRSVLVGKRCSKCDDLTTLLANMDQGAIMLMIDLD